MFIQSDSKIPVQLKGQKYISHGELTVTTLHKSLKKVSVQDYIVTRRIHVTCITPGVRMCTGNSGSL